MNQHVVPDDFPRKVRLGAVSGAQPNLLLRNVSNKHCADRTEEALCEQYVQCDDLVQQRAVYATGEMTENPCSREEALLRLEATVARKIHIAIWNFSASEIVSAMGPTRPGLSGTASSNEYSTADSSIWIRGMGRHHGE
jgi:hypothetical protein